MLNLSHCKSIFIVFALILPMTGIPGVVHAGIVTSSEIVNSEQTIQQREQIRDLLARTDMQKALAAQGVDPQAAQQRIDTMTAEEVQLLALKMDQLPAGGRLTTIELLLIIIIIILLV